jgi:hypothetical protein
MLSPTAKMEVSVHFNVSSTSTWSKRYKKREREGERSDDDGYKLVCVRALCVLCVVVGMWRHDWPNFSFQVSRPPTVGMGDGILPRYIYLKNPENYVPEGVLYGKDPG